MTHFLCDIHHFHDHCPALPHLWLPRRAIAQVSSIKHLLGGQPLKKPRFTMPKEITAIHLRHKLGEILDAVANKRG